MYHSAQFLRQDGTPFDNIQHSISFGPVFIDRDSRNRLHQFYTTEFSLAKTRGVGEWLAGNEPIEEAKSLPAMFSSGLIDLDSKAINKRTKLEEVSRSNLTLRYGVYLFQRLIWRGLQPLESDSSNTRALWGIYLPVQQRNKR